MNKRRKEKAIFDAGRKKIKKEIGQKDVEGEDGGRKGKVRGETILERK